MPATPNVVVCLCDQLRAFECGCYGSEFVRTPNIDRLARGGVRFDIACSNNPVCTPGRSMLLSGQYSRTCLGNLVNVAEPVPERNQLRDPTMPEVFRRAGYDTAVIGKWHIGPEPNAIGFDHAVYPHHSHRYTGQTFFRNGEEPIVVEGFQPEFEGDELAAYLREHHDRPFFLYYNISQPHMPVYDAPEGYRTMYPPSEVPLRGNAFIDGKPAYDERWFRIYLWDYLYYQKHLPYTETLPDGFDLRALTALYCGMVTWADDQLGRLMGLLERNGLAENTLVIFTSDHGDNLGSHHLFNKDQLYEESIRIPMIFHWPEALSSRQSVQQVVSLVDVMPTVLSLAGLETPDTVQGTDVSAVVRGHEEIVGENLAFIETSQGEIGVRSQRYLVGAVKERDGHGRTTTVSDSNHLLFDMVADPLQQNNLAGTGEPIAATIRDRLLRWDLQTPWMT